MAGFQRSIIASFFFFLLNAGCKEAQNESVHYKSAVGIKSSKDFLIPRELAAEIEKNYLSFIRKENPKVVLSDEEIVGRIPREFLEVEMQLRSSAPGVLRDHYAVKLPRGGGIIDLKDYVTGGKGSFFMKFAVKKSDGSNRPVRHLTIYFLSEAKQREIDGETFGMGCKKYVNVTERLTATDTSGGFQLNATDRRYLPVIGGVFYFIGMDPERKIYLAAVRVYDSRYPEEMCMDLSTEK